MAKILVVDDDNLFRTVIMEILEMHGHVCVGAQSVEEAKAKLSVESYELVLSDYHMPGETGLDLLRHLSAQCPETRFIMVSAADGGETREQACQQGADAYLSKPFNMQELLSAIDATMSRKEACTLVAAWRRTLSEIRTHGWSAPVLIQSL